MPLPVCRSKTTFAAKLNYDVAVTGDTAKPGLGKRTAGG